MFKFVTIKNIFLLKKNMFVIIPYFAVWNILFVRDSSENIIMFFKVANLWFEGVNFLLHQNGIKYVTLR